MGTAYEGSTPEKRLVKRDRTKGREGGQAKKWKKS
jgi:hypothetical protein